MKDSGASLGLAFTAVPSRGHDLGNGHAVVAAVDISEGKAQGLGRAFTDQVAKEKHLIRRARLIARYGEGWVNRMFANRNLNIFPNFMLIDLVMGMTIRTFYPESPDYMEINAWSVMPPGLDEETHKQRMDNFLTFWGPAGLATPDDVEALERCQEGFRMHRDAPWNDISRGMNFEQPSGLHELQMRTFWRKWNELMTGEISALEVPLYQPRGRVALAR